MAEGEKILRINIEEEMKSAYIDYSMSVIVSRALPDVRDGMKPVHRRVLFGMSDLGVFSNRPYKKSARIVGEVLGKYHPHGDSSVYDAMVRMAQEWSLRYPLVEGQGNFGSVDGDSPAAMRYTEARLQKIAEESMADMDKNTVDFQLNFDDTLEEPTVLPTRVPTLLINGTSGIAVGMATNMPPHNLTDSVDAIVAYINNNDIEISELTEILQEQKLSQSKLIDRTTALRLGKLVAVHAIVTGSIIETNAGIEIVSKMIDTETSEILATEDVYDEDKDPSALKALAEAMAIKIHRDFPLVHGLVIDKKKNQIFTDLGEEKIRRQKRVLVYRETVLEHPVTKKPLGTDNEIIGRAVFTQVMPEASKAELVSGSVADIQPMDKVITQ